MLKPRENIVMVERVEAKSTSDGGIILPDAAKQQTNKGKVLAIGTYFDDLSNRLRTIPQLKDLKVDNIVYFPKYAGNEIEENGKTYLFLSYQDVLAIEE